MTVLLVLAAVVVAVLFTWPGLVIAACGAIVRRLSGSSVQPSEDDRRG